LFNPYESSGASTVIKYLTKHINLERQGKLSEEWYNFTSSSNLIAITKKLRPIGMGYSGRKLVSGVSLLNAAKAIRKKFAPFQLSSLIRNGPESVVHLIRHLHEVYGDSHIFLQIDVKNAFNSVSRLRGLLAIAQHIPQLYTYILRTYRNMNKLWVNATDDQIRDHLLSQEGSTQGAVDGGIFFNCAINETIQELNELVLQLGGGVFVAIADDIVGCIKPEALLPAFQIIEHRFRNLNLQLNYEKSTIFSNNQETIDMIAFDESTTLQRVKVTTEGIILLGSAISKNIEFHNRFIQSKIDEARHVLHAITLFGKEYLQQAIVLLKSCFISKFSYLSRVTPPHILEPYSVNIMKNIKICISNMIQHTLTDPQWQQSILKPRHGGLGIMDITSTSKGAYLASILACLSNIDCIDRHQHLELNVLQFDQSGMPDQTNSFKNVIIEGYEHVRKLHTEALKIDHDLSMQVLQRLPSADRKTPGCITPEDRYKRMCAIQTRAGTAFPKVSELVAKNSKLQAMFSDAASKVARAKLFAHLDPESVIRIHSASDEGAACIQTQPTAPNRCFTSLEFRIFIYLRLGIQISKEDINCPACLSSEGLSNLHLVNGCKHGDYVHRKHNVVIEEIKRLCNAANLLVDIETPYCFQDQSNKRMDLVVQ
jgi:hypothetical protein